MTFKNFTELFRRATENPNPFPYQIRFAEADEFPELVHAPTGAGKTATAILGWLWKYLYTGKPTPRRLAYCLPMRVLVEQTRDEAKKWLKNLELSEKVRVHILMGGEDTEEWDLDPEKPAILIGTQDMLLSRALNRGYGMSRFRWPMHFGLLNSDTLWVLDEIQLMGTGLATSTQLQAFREALGMYGTTKTVWMSATLLPRWLSSVDYRDRIEPELRLRTLRLDPMTDYQADGLRERWEAKKPIRRAALVRNAERQEKVETAEEVAFPVDEPVKVAEFVKTKHQPGSLTLVIVNTVDRCQSLFEAIRTIYSPKPRGRGRNAAQTTPPPTPELKLIHSRFRPKERKEWRSWLTAKELPALGRIVVSTQVVEAGVDLSARTLITELAPWPSLVQRFGRCNRRGEFPDKNGTDPAQVFWIDVPTPDEKKAAPYTKAELDEARTRIASVPDVGLKALTALFDILTDEERNRLFLFDPPHVIRRKDFIDLFDTTPDLAGNDIDVSRFIREGEELDVQVFWRTDVPDGSWTKVEHRRPDPQRDELCCVPFVRFRDFLQQDKTAYRWDALDGKWNRMTKADVDSVYPGQVYWLQVTEGGYSAETGWEPAVKSVDPQLILPLPELEKVGKPEGSYDDDEYSSYESGWQTVAEHTQEVFDAVEMIASDSPLPDDVRVALRVGTRWHDWGKAHEIFQAAITKPSGWEARTLFAKAPEGCWAKYKRKHFRHELASALGVLALFKCGLVPDDWKLDEHLTNLALYLIAAHHGKVRLSIRSMPDEETPHTPGSLYARGVWEGDSLPAVELGGNITAPTVALDLSPMLLGRVNGLPSWAERVFKLRDSKELGPLRLAYLEAMVRAADMRASKAANERAKKSKGGRA
jgi:CRISPR-associated endonuclease/helicase Cas3